MSTESYLDDYPNPEQLKVFKQRLEKRLAELKALSASSQDVRSAVSLDQSRVGRLSRMDAIQMQEMERANEARRAVENQRIEQALKLIEDDLYGFCVICGETIARKRLELDPSFITCVACS